MNKRTVFRLFFISLVVVIAYTSCKLQNKITNSEEIKIVAVNPENFITTNLIGEIQKKTVDLDGTPTLCYVIKSKSQPAEHQMGPWCPRNISDSKEKGGIWFKDGKVYDVDGHFIAELAEFYSDDRWKLFREDGSIKVTKTQEECEGAAKPNVDEEYNNYCVECLPAYYKDQTKTYYIPVKPKYLDSSRGFGRNGLGLAFNGVSYDPPAPTHAILAAHTLAPLDSNGGHVNPHGGYHYHAATGSTKEIAQADSHSPMIGYAMDGFGIYAYLDKNNTPPQDLDECNGHSDPIRGYHYHAGTAGGNQIIKCLHGVSGYMEVEE
jgi:hypothetical protein